MIYMGSKSRYAKYIAPILQKIIDENNIETYIEPFVGGANLIDKIRCKNRIGSDLSESVIILLKAARDDMSSIPMDGSRELWDIAKNDLDGATSLEKSAIEWLGSYNSRGFPGGYAKTSGNRNYYQERYKNLLKQSPFLKGINFIVGDYKEYLDSSLGLIESPKTLVYCDPPYYGTKGYGVNRDFSHEEFWSWVKELSNNAIVTVSEETIPLDESEYSMLWQKDVKRTIGGKSFLAQEKLIRILGESDK